MMHRSEPMRGQLLGYLLEALEPDERQRLEADLMRHPKLQRDLEAINDSLEPLRRSEDPPDPPTGLAERTCQRIAAFQARPPTAACRSLARVAERGS